MARSFRHHLVHHSARTLSFRTLGRFLLMAAGLLLLRTEVYATHAMGGALTYQCVGPNQYKVSLAFYRDCNGVAAPTNCNNGLGFQVRSTQCGANFNDCFSLESVQVITPICASETDRCLASSGIYGVERYVFSKVVNLNAWANCGTDWVFSWELCCRNNAVTSLQNPGNQRLYLDATMNNTLSACNSSPSFLTNPTPFYCLGQSVSYNNGAFDVDGDSLSYELIAARGQNGVNLNYNAGYSATQPIRNAGGVNAVTLDPVTGSLTVVPSIIQVAVVTYRIREYRNGIQIGSVTRDVQVVVRPCPGNSAPTASGINGTTNYNVSVCAGVPITFTINSTDPNAGQNVTMSWNNGIPGATFTASGSPFPTGTFSWTPPPSAVGTNLFTVLVEDDACPLKASNDFGYTITVTPPVTPANAGPDQSVCGSSATMAGVQPFPQTQGTWTVVSGSGVFANPNAPNTQVTGLSQGQNVFQWTLDFQTCGTTSDQVVVTSFNPAQAAANAGPPQSLCLPLNSTTLVGNTAVAPAVGTWSVVSGPGTITSPNSPTTTVSGLGIGTNTFRWTINNGPCGAPTTSQVTVLVFNDQQGVANAGPDQQLCTPTSTTNLNANAAVFPATGSWTLVQGAGTIVSPTSASTQIVGLGIGVNRFRWTISNGPCTPASTQDEVTVLVFDANSPAANAGPDQQICAPPANATLLGNTPTFPATGTWTVVSGTGTITNPSSPSTTVTGLGAGTNVFQWTLSNGPCAGGITSDQVSIVVFDQNAAVANAGPDQSICSTTPSITLAGNTVPAPAVGTWTVVSGTATITNPTNPTTTVTGLSSGLVVLQWSINNGPCGAPSTDQMTVQVFSATQPAANAGPDQALCTPTTTATLAGNVAIAPAVGTWTLVRGSGAVTSPNSPTSTVTGLGVGVNTFRWSISNGPCANPNTNDLVSITVFSNANPIANAGPDQSICTPTNSTTLAGSSLTAPATGTWTLVSGSGTISNPSAPNSSVNGLAVGENIFLWTVNNGPCGPATSDQVSIFVFSATQPVANAGPDQSICTPTTSVTLAGSAVTFPGTGTWNIVSGSGTITSPSSPTSTVTGLGVGVTVLQWTVLNGPCGSVTTDQVSISVFSGGLPSANAGPDQTICVPTFPSQVTLQGSTAIAPAVGTWTLVSGSGNITAPNSPTSTVTALGVGVNVFQWSVNNGPCGAPTSDQMTVFVFDAANPVANAGPDQNLCTPLTTTTMQGSGLIPPATGTWTLVSGSGSITDPNSPNSGITGLALGANIFQWTVSNGNCANPVTVDQVVINVFNGSAQQATAGPDQDICSTTTTVTMAGNAPVGIATGLWTVVQGSGTFANAAVANTSVSGLAVGTNIFRWSIDNGACGTSFDEVTVTVFSQSNLAANAGPDQDLCTPVTSATMAGSAITFPATGTWTLISGTGAIVNPAAPNTLINGLSIGANVFQWTVNNGPCPNGVTNDLVIVNVFDNNAPAADAGPDQELCTPTTDAILSGNVPVGVATGTWSLAQGSGVITSAGSPSTQVTGLAVGENIFVWTINNGNCASTADSVSIFLFDDSMAPAAAGADQFLCLPQTTASLSGSALIFPATGLWSLIGGNGVIVDPTNNNTSITGLALGQNIFTWTVDNGPCASGITVDTVMIQVNDPNTPAADAGMDLSICTPQSDVTMSASAVIAPATGSWSLVSGTGIITDPTDPNTTITGLPVGVHVFAWSVDNGGCATGQTSDQVQVSVYDQSTPQANAGPDQQLCTPVQSTTMAGSPVIAPGIGTWSLLAGTAQIIDVNDPSTAVTGLAIGENILIWSVDNGPCGSGITTDTVSVFLFDENNLVANAGPDQNLCTPTLNTVMAGSAVTFPAVGTWTLVSGSGAIADPNSPTSSINGLAIGENIFAWTVDNGPCASGITTDQVSIFVFSGNDPAANAGPDQSICTPLTAVTLAGSPYTSPAIGTWTLVSGTGVFVNPNDPNTDVVAMGVGENIFAWTVNSGPCSNGITTDQVSVFVYDASNPVANAGPSQEICTPNSTVTLSGSPVTFPAVGTWSVVSGTAIIVNPNDPASVVIDLVVGETILQWSVSNGPCANALTTDTMRVRVFDENSPPADAGPDQSLCTPTTTTVLAGNTPTFPAQGQWSVIQGSASFLAPNSPTGQVTDLAVGVNILAWTITNGPCAGGVTSDQVTILVYDLNNAPADAGPDIIVCTPDTATQLFGNTPTIPALGTWTVISGTGIVIDPNDPETRIEGLTIGETVAVWSVDNGPCAPPITTDTVLIQVFDSSVPAADAGPDQQICTPVTSAVMAGSPVVFPGTGQWTLISGGGVIADPTSPTTVVTDLAVGENIFEWVVDNASCGSGLSSDQVSLFLFDTNSPPADAGPDQSFCSPDESTSLQGNVPAPPAIGTWALVNGTGNIGNTALPNSNIDGLTIGENILTWTIDLGVCGLSVDSVSLRVYDENNPAADAGIAQQLCTPADSTMLGAVAPNFPAIGTWSLVQGAGQIAAVNDPNTEVSGLAIGDNIFQWTVFNGPCTNPDSIAFVTITLFDDSTSAADAGPDLETCLPFAQVGLEAVIPQQPATGTWTILSGGGVIADVNNPNSLMTGIPLGITTLLWTLDNGPCPDNGILTDTMQVTVFDPSAPPADAGPDQQLCTPDTSTVLAGNIPLFPAVGTWQLFSGSGVIQDINDPATVVTGLAIGDNVFVWTIYNGLCGFGPPSHDTVTVTVFDASQPPALVGPDQQFCAPIASATLDANAASYPASGLWSVANGQGVFVDDQDPLTVVNGLVVGQNTFVWTMDNGACGSTTDSVSVFIFDDNLPAADAGPDQQICVPTAPNTVVMAGSVPIFPAVRTWTLISGTGVITDPNDPATSITDLVVGTHVFEWTMDNGPCTNTSDQVTISVYDAAQPAANAGPDQDLCFPATSVQLAGNAVTSPATGTWTIIIGQGVLTDPNDPNATLSDLPLGETVVVWTISNGPCPTSVTSDTLVITVFDNTLQSAAAGPDQSFCTPLEPPITMLASSVSLPAIGTWALLSGSATILSPNDPFTGVWDLGLGENVFSWTVDNGPCGSSSDDISIFIYDGSLSPADAGEDQQFCQDVSSTDLAAVPVMSTGTGTWSLVNGSGNINNPSDPATNVSGLPLGYNGFAWTVTNGACPTTSDTMFVFIEDCLTLIIPDAFSPNGDGVNDIYTIHNLESYPANSLQIFNRWGNKVLDRKPYVNDWDGRSEGSLNWGDQLPEGTYYYILDLGNGTDAYTGYIYLRR